MIRIITGAQNSLKQVKLFEYIKSVDDKNKVLVIVPEQFTFEYEKMLYNLLGPTEYNKINVLSFKRLGKKLNDEYNAQTGVSDNDNIRIIMIYNALKRLKTEKELSYFQKSSEKNSFVNDLLDVIEEFRYSGLPADEILKLATLYKAEASESTSKAASVELAKIYKAYNDVLTEYSVCDSLTLPTIAAHILSGKKPFKEYQVFLDEFSGFTPDEFEVVMELAMQADITACLTMQENNMSKLSPTAVSIATQNKLISVAKENNIHVEYDICDDYSLCLSKPIIALNKGLFNIRQINEINNGDVRIINALDRYRELEICAAQISHLVLEDGYKYSDIVVVSGNVSDYSEIAEGTFERYNIPFYVDYKQSAAQSALVLHVMNILDAVSTRRYNTEKILKYIKSPVSYLTDNEKSIIEDYCVSWNVNKDMWMSDFTAISSGFADEAESPEKKERKLQELEKINAIRKKIIEPLDKFRNACSDKRARDMCKALFEFFEETKLSQQVYSNALNTIDKDNENTIEVSRSIKQLWINLTEAIKNIYDYGTKEKLTVKEFSNLLRLLLSQLNISSAPQKLDSVMLASAGRSRIGTPKVVFVLGATEGVFPANPHGSMLFNDKNREYLKKSGVPISRDNMELMLRERYVAYSVIASAQERLYVSYPSYDGRDAILRPSGAVKQMLNILPGTTIVSASTYSTLWYCTNMKSAYYKYIENYSEKNEDIITLRELLLSDAEYAKKLEYIEKRKNGSEKVLSPEISKKLFIKGGNNTLVSSASSIERFFKCPFVYFMDKGLKIRKIRKNELNAPNIGSLLHFCLEKLMSVEVNSKKTYNEEFTVLSEAAVRKGISETFDKYKELCFGGDFGKSYLYEYQFNRLKENTFYIIRNMQKELSESKLKPEFFEKSLKKDNGENFFNCLCGNVVLKLIGSVDRIDIGSCDDGRLLRIVDYKSGSKKFAKSDIVYGLNMQMLLYLIAVMQDKDEFSECIETGILYQKIEPPYDFVEREKASEESIMKNEQDQLKAFGIGVDEYISKDYQGDVSLEPFTKNEFEAIKRLVYIKLEEFVSCLENGEINPMPVNVKGSKNLPCDYCDYWSVCGVVNKVEGKIVSDEDDELFNRKLESILDNDM